MRKTPTPESVIDFWLAAGPDRWFKKDDDFDRELTDRFGDMSEQAADGGLDDWTGTAKGTLALILLLDQFRRNIHRGTPDAFSADPKALDIAELAVQSGFDRSVPTEQRIWFYMPFEHAEDLGAQERCIGLVKDLCSDLGDDEYLKYAVIHRDIIQEFGRFPHRNPILGRNSTPEELAFLDQGGFAG